MMGRKLTKAAKSSLYKEVSKVIQINNKLLFPISWLQTQEFCEYQIFLENIKGIKVEPTRAMIEGEQKHEELYDDFKKEAKPTTFNEMVVQSKTVEVVSREFRVRDLSHGVYGKIDEVLLTPDEFIVIDDKPGTKPFLSDIHQVYGYCLALQTMVKPLDGRLVVAALRERGTNNIHWRAPFNLQARKEIITVVKRIHALISGVEEFKSAYNPNKCRSCRLRDRCDRAKI
jgi:CRISPR-associated exonuclease Cas4